MKPRKVAFVPARLDFAPILVMLAAVVATWAATPVRGELTDIAAPWPADADWAQYLVNGNPIIDAEGGKANDHSNGGASFSGETDISSGWPQTVGPCTYQGPPPDTQCGTQTSGFMFYDDNGTIGDISDDVFYARMRVNGNPQGTSANGFGQDHWNYLFDVEQSGAVDGYKELWFDIFGGFNGGNEPDQLRILFEDNDSNEITNDAGAGDSAGCGGSSTPGGTFVNSFYACNAVGLTACQDAAGNDLSHTRVVPANDGTGEYWVDIQVPVTAMTDNTGCYSGPTKFTDPEDLVLGNQIVTDPSMFTMLFSTSNSNINPLQKDYVDSDFGDIGSTPVTLAWFAASAVTGGIRFEWATATESANAGFELSERVNGRWRRINEHLIPSHRLDSAAPQTYFYEAAGVTGTEYQIVDVSTTIERREHGPFALGQTYGSPPVRRVIDWATIRAEHAASRADRDLQARAATRRRIAAVLRPASAAKDASRFSASDLCELLVENTGVYRVSFSDLAAAGVEMANVPRASLALMNRGRSVPIRIVESDLRGFGGASDGFIEFFGEAIESLYTTTNVYRLVIDQRAARRMTIDRRSPPSGVTPPEAYRERITVNDDHEYHFMSPTGDPWYDVRMLAFAGAPVTVDRVLTVDHLVGSGGQVDVGVWGVTDWPDRPDHHIQVYFNGQLIADDFFDGLANRPLGVEIDPGMLRDGKNLLRLVLPGDTGVAFDMVNLDTYGLAFDRAFVARGDQLDFFEAGRVFEVSGFKDGDIAAYRIENGRFGDEVTYVDRISVTLGENEFAARFAGSTTGRPARHFVVSSAGLFAPTIVPVRPTGNLTSGSADYLVIAHPSFIPGLAPLVEARTAQGWTVKVVNVEDVYRRFNYGIFDPSAIRQYIRFASENLGTRAVLLVGGDTFDYHDHLGLGSMSFIPTLYTDIGNGAAFTPSDPLMADTNGDRVPDVAIGRFPVRTAAELGFVVRKTIAFDDQAHGQIAVFAADGNEPDTPFREIAESLVARMPGDWRVTTAFIDDLGVDGARAALIDAVDRGVALASFVGHSGPNAWTFDGLLRTDDIAAFTNYGKPAVVSQWGCWNTYYVEPSVDTMAHAFMLQGEHGGAAVLGAATITSAAADREFAPLLQSAMIEPGMPLGEAVLRSKRELAQDEPRLVEVILGSTLLGDPGLVVVP